MLVFTKNVVNCSNGEIKYKLSALLHISYLRGIKYCIHVKELDSDFLTAIKSVDTYFNLGIHWGKM